VRHNLKVFSAAPAVEFLKEKSGDTVTEVPNLAYTRWMAHDQALLGYIFSSLTHEVLMSVTTHSTSAAVWAALDEMFASHTRT
jgi:hypothetical protein